MVVEYIRYRIAESSAGEFEDAYRRAAVPLSRSPQCVDFELSRCEEDPEQYILRITWTSTQEHLEGFRASDAFRAFFAEIKPYVDAIEEMRHYRPTGIEGTGAAIPTLYDWAGGTAAFEKLFSAFYDKVVKDEVLEPVFHGMNPDHPRHVAAWLAEVFGGPKVYSERHGGHAHMVGRHLGRAITESQRRRWVTLLIDTADEVGLPDDPEFRAAFVGYLEWGTRMAVILSGPGAEPDLHEPVPAWTWPRPPWQPSDTRLSTIPERADGNGREPVSKG
ncbi:group II truncated hemoglobin [Phytoactinopolyspora endophytica]|uniref:group II truncated hemoglobin n=1 Tax=Phytoactinopolyspora endophytica TaxID=1642495 RepID=UPI00197BDC99|nr:antibiotic biosynthesis monooxygenase [Phytoactinopolyspora endophytica]